MAKKKPICIGTGLVALDVILNGNPKTLPKMSAGGSCGNVLSILAFLGWESLPVARLADNPATVELLSDFSRWHVNETFLKINDEGSTPIIIHRILKDAEGNPNHRFEFRDPESKDWLPNFKPITINFAREITEQVIQPQVFYFDRANPGTIELASHYRDKGALIFFEPSSIKDERLFSKSLSLSHVVKFSNDRIKDYKDRYKTSQTELEIETQGKDGIIYRTSKSKSNQWKRIKPFMVDKVVDTAGAGDWCSASIIMKLGVEGYSLFKSKSNHEIEDALNFGQLLAGLNCMFDGARGLMYHFSKTSLQRIVSGTFGKNEISFGDVSSFKKTIIDNSKRTSISSLY